MKKLMLLTALAFSAIANAGPLNGKVMHCKHESTSGTVFTNYEFLRDGFNEVLARNSNEGDAVVKYKLQGTDLYIQRDGSWSFIVYDISNPQAVTGSYQVCVSPGVPDGGSRPFCQQVTDVCTLN